MQRSDKIISRLNPSGAFSPDAFPGVPIVEIAGTGRVLIEGHQGVTEYDTERIQVKMVYGSLSILGCGLTLAHMSKHQLVVVGRIQQLCVCRG